MNLFKEIKWTRITDQYRSKYVEFIQRYFEFVASGRIKIRIMFSHNYHKPTNLNEEQKDNGYFLLYYQLIKHAFGFRYSNPNDIDRVFVSILFDELPDSRAKCDAFKEYVSAISQTATYSGSGVFFPKEQIAEIDSNSHAIHQGLDIILGAMHFRLNDLHKEKPEGAPRRGKRTIAKEKVYKEINRLIRLTYPNFNIGSSTGKPNGPADRWTMPYRHWRFIPSEYETDDTAVKPKK